MMCWSKCSVGPDYNQNDLGELLGPRVGMSVISFPSLEQDITLTRGLRRPSECCKLICVVFPQTLCFLVWAADKPESRCDHNMARSINQP
jgi:hypothetical protein